MPARDLDLVLFGATGFTGRLVAEYLAGRLAQGGPPGTSIPAPRVALAGRSAEKLAAIRDGLGEAAQDWPLVPADSSDPDSLRALAERSHVVVTTVGPYAEYGLPLVEACARAGTHYTDLTGEVLFMRDSIERYDALAQESGARIVHSCGFDSIPSDLGVWDLAQTVAADEQGELTDTTLVVTGMRGGISGGTLASARTELAAIRADPSRRAVAGDPYALSPGRDDEPDLGDEGDVRGTFFDEHAGQWVAPFVMAGVNTRVVRRSNALLQYHYGRRFRYREVMGLGTGPEAAAKGAAMAAGMGGITALLGNSVTGGVADAVAARVLPKPGEGPDEEARRKGFFRIEIVTTTSTGARYTQHVAAQGDPGYAATCVMLGESGLCLAQDGDRLPGVAGVLTPATAFDGVLIERLRAAGMTFEARRQDRADLA
jgi:short subunit dehydrogenase-like uncharacterized protein